MARTPATYPASRSNGTRTKPAAHFVRFTEAQNARLHQVAEREGKNINQLIHEATMVALDEADRRHLERETRRNPLLPQGDLPPRPRGYGLRQRLAEVHPPEPPPPVEPPPPPAPQVVIHTAPQTTTPEMDRLATFVVHGGPDDRREERLRTAAGVLAATAKDEAEKHALARALDEKIATLSATPPIKKSPLDFLDAFFR